MTQLTLDQELKIATRTYRLGADITRRDPLGDLFLNSSKIGPRVCWRLSQPQTPKNTLVLAVMIPSESESEVAQSCLTLYHPMDCSLLGSSVHGILQARILEWVAISFSKWSPKSKNNRNKRSQTDFRNWDRVWRYKCPGRMGQIYGASPQ